MNWDDVTNAVKKYAPVLGAAIGGPVGGAVGGAISLIASAFGVGSDSPDEIYNAIQADPQAALKLKEIEAGNKIELQRIVMLREQNQLAADTQRILAINATMQAESKSEHWPQWGWRPYWGFISGTAFLAVCVLICSLAWKAVTNADSASVGMIPIIIGAFTALFAIPGSLLGITAWGRNKLKIEEMANKIHG